VLPYASQTDREPRTYRTVECIFLFVLAPVGVALIPGHLHLLPLLWILTGLCLVLLLREPHFDRRDFFRTASFRHWLEPMLLRFVPLAALITAGVLLFRRDMLFGFVRSRPVVWAIVMVLYPVLSVYPQGIIYRGFFMRRYEALFGSSRLMLLASAAAFSFMHIVLLNPVAIALTFVGGLLFNRTYVRSRSLLVSAIEHSLYGCFLFTIGLGRYFYGGAR
jgi:membrane protease YdiL (CAAX protease family)